MSKASPAASSMVAPSSSTSAAILRTRRISVCPPETSKAPRFAGNPPLSLSTAMDSSSKPTPTWATRWLMAYRGLPVAKAKALAALTPTMSAPARPGPLVTAKASTSAKVTPASFKARCSVGTKASRWAREAISGMTPPKRMCSSMEEETVLVNSVVPRTSPTPVSSQEDSIPKISGMVRFIGGPSRWWVHRM